MAKILTDQIHLDTVKSTYGTGSDLQIYHNATNSLIENSTGDFYISNKHDDGDIIFFCDNGSGGTTEYFRLDGGTTTNVFSKTITVTGSGTFSDKVNIGGSTNNDSALNVRTANGSTGSIGFETGGEITGIISCATDTMDFRVGDGVGMGNARTLRLGTGGIGVTGNIDVSGTVDGRDVASDGSKLDGISSNARTGTVTSVSASTSSSLDGLSVSSGTTTPVVGLDIVGMGDYADGFDDGSIDYSQVFVPICDDDNGGGNKKTSVKALIEGGVDSKHQFVLNSNFSDDTSTTSSIYFPFNSLTDGTSSQYYRHWAAPCTGRVKRIIMQHTSGTMSSSFSTTLQVYKNGSTFTTSGSLSVTTTNDGGYIEYNPSGTGVAFVKGDRIRIRYAKSATGKYWRGVAASIIIELDQV